MNNIVAADSNKKIHVVLDNLDAHRVPQRPLATRAARCKLRASQAGSHARAATALQIRTGETDLVNSHGRFVWYELMTTDMEAAKAFYADVVGWGTQDASMPGMAYTLFTAGGASVSGLMDLPEDARKLGLRPSWIGYVGVNDVDAAADRIKQPWRRRARPTDGHPQHQPRFGRRRPADGNDRVVQVADTAAKSSPRS